MLCGQGFGFNVGIGVLKSQVLGEGGFETFDGGTLRVVYDGFAERNGIVEAL